MILYNVTVNVESDVATEWLQWMQEVHIPDVMKTGLFVEHKLFRLLNEVEDNTGITYSVQYFAKNMADYQHYQDKYAKELQFEHTRRYKGKFVAFRSILESLT